MCFICFRCKNILFLLFYSNQPISQKKRIIDKVQSQSNSENQQQQYSRSSLIVTTKQEIIAEDEYEQPHSSSNHSGDRHHTQATVSSNRYATSNTEKERESYQYYSKQQVQNLEGEKLIKCSSSPLRSKEVSFNVK